MSHHQDVVEIYHVLMEADVAPIADHVLTCDETIVPGHLHGTDKKDIKRCLERSLGKARGLPMAVWLTWLTISMVGPLVAPSQHVALDLTHGWDFSQKNHRAGARQLVNVKDPRMLLLSTGTSSHAADPESHDRFGYELASWQYLSVL